MVSGSSPSLPYLSGVRFAWTFPPRPLRLCRFVSTFLLVVLLVVGGAGSLLADAQANALDIVEQRIVQWTARPLNFSETDPPVLWLVTTTDATWQLQEASDPAELILRRHRWSGRRLVFETPTESTHPLLARRLRATDDAEQRQTLLREEFFDRLYDVSGQNVMLALFYWFRAATLAEDEAETGSPFDSVC